MTDDLDRSFLLGRLDAIGKAQARYLWYLLLACLFFAALRGGASSSSVQVPVFDLGLDTATVVASGGPVLAMLVLAVMGSIRAWTQVVQEVKRVTPSAHSDALDTNPNLLDLAFFKTDRAPHVVAWLRHVAYPFVLSLAIVESGWLGLDLLHAEHVQARRVFMIMQLLTWIPAAFAVLVMWWERRDVLLGRPRAA